MPEEHNPVTCRFHAKEDHYHQMYSLPITSFQSIQDLCKLFQHDEHWPHYGTVPIDITHRRPLGDTNIKYRLEIPESKEIK